MLPEDKVRDRFKRYYDWLDESVDKQFEEIDYDDIGIIAAILSVSESLLKV